MERVTPTIRDVAERAGVSAGTASRALNGHDRVSPATRLAVQAAADELHYVPNALIRSLQSGRTNTVGLFMWRITDQSYASISNTLVQGILSSLGEIKRDALFYHRHPHEQEGCPAYFLDGRVDGVILAPGFLDAKEVTVLTYAGMPVVALYQGEAGGRAATVNIDNRSGVGQAVDRLIALGHSRIAFVSPDYTYDFGDRRLGWQDAMNRAGLPHGPEWSPPIRSEHGPEVPDTVRELMARAQPPTAIVAGDDGIALRVIAVLAALGIEVPRRVSVIGFDDVPGVAESHGLTTLRHPAGDVGIAAGRFIGRLLSGERARNCRALLAVDYVERSTTAPAPGSNGRRT